MVSWLFDVRSYKGAVKNEMWQQLKAFLFANKS